MKKIGFIGMGVMGTSMVRNLMKSGYELSIYTRTKNKAEALVNEGAIWNSSIKECVSKCDVVMTMVGYPKDVEEVYFGKEGILKSCQKGTFLIDMTTTSPKLSIKIFEEAKKLELFALDAPVSGGGCWCKECNIIYYGRGRKRSI